MPKSRVYYTSEVKMAYKYVLEYIDPEDSHYKRRDWLLGKVFLSKVPIVPGKRIDKVAWSVADNGVYAGQHYGIFAGGLEINFLGSATQNTEAALMPPFMN